MCFSMRAGANVAGRRHGDRLMRAEHHGAEHAADRLGEAGAGVLRDRAADRGSRNPRPARAAAAREAKRWITSTVSEADAAMNRNTSRPLYELRALATGTMDSHATPSCVGMCAPVSACVTGAEQVDHHAWEDAGQQAERGEAEHRGERAAIDLARVCRHAGARPAEEGDAERLDEARGGECGGQRQQRAIRRDHDLQRPIAAGRDAAGSPGRSATRRRSRSAAAARRSRRSRPGRRTRSSACDGSGRRDDPCRARRSRSARRRRRRTAGS